ncbi:TPR-like protein [Dendrothele bispora CBS 962.96]|uniref:TPR-like protein n=1 Tax=Dendrothele bispora (strain CBS 962.96) TaxID=1314807 RepID=A0A4S8M1P2_DENBC|nr:TPR-like protein [Dendrothele bispora CBS 962.96]
MGNDQEAERADADVLLFGQRCMSMKEYTRAAYHTRGCTSAKALFINIYSRFLVSEKRALLEWHNEDSTRMQPLQPVNKEISDLLAEVENTRKKDPFLLFLKALFYARMSRADDVRETLAESLSAYPWNWSAWTLLGTCVDSSSLLQEVLASVKLPPNHPLPKMFQIKILNELQAASETEIGLCDHLLSEDWFPKSLWVMSHRARALYGLTHFERAEEQFEKLMDLDPDRVDDVDIYSNILYTLQQDKKLTLLAERFMKKDKDRPEVCCIVGNHYSMRGEHEKAVKYFRRATQLDRTCFHAWTLLGHEYLEMANAPAAIESYRVALAIDTKDYRPWFGLGQAYTQLGLPTYALFYYQKASYLRPSEYVLWDGLGECYEQLAP